MKAFDASRNTVLAQLDGWELRVDVANLPVDIVFSKGSLFQFIGSVIVKQVCSIAYEAAVVFDSILLKLIDEE